MSTVHSLNTAPVNVYSKTYWTNFITAVNEEAAYELGLHDKINKEALPTTKGWSASLFTPNILRHTEFFVDRSTKIDFSTHNTVHHHHSSPKSLTKEELAAKKKEESSLQKYKFLGPIIGSIGAFLAAYTWSGYQRCQATLNYTQRVKNECTKLFEDKTPLKPTLQGIVDNKLQVDEIRYNIIYRYFCACAGILVGGGLLTLGAYMKQPSLIPWGGIALAASAIWAAASAGLHLQDNQDIKSLYGAIVLRTDRVTEQALSHLYWYYQEGMILKPEYVQPPEAFVPPQYPSFFTNIPESYVPVYGVRGPNINAEYNPYMSYPPVQEPDDMEFPLI
jgi:hypothetical protein